MSTHDNDTSSSCMFLSSAQKYTEVISNFAPIQCRIAFLCLYIY